MRTAVFYGVLAGLGIVSSLQGCSCKDNDDAPTTVDGGAVVIEGGTSETGSSCLDQDPPSGFSAISSGDGKPGNYGVHTAMTLDDKGSPLVAFVHWGPDGGSEGKDSILYFTRWDRCTATWTTPVNVDGVAAISTDDTLRQVAIARDATTGAIGIAFEHVTYPVNENAYPETFFASSTDQGATWTKGVVSVVTAGEGSIHATSGPGLAMNAGKVFMAYAQENVYCTAAEEEHCNGWYAEGTPSNWTRTILPNLPGGFGASLLAPVTVQVDRSGKAAVAYLVAPNTAYNTQVAFWRPGSATAVKVMDSHNTQNDAPSLSMIFEGDKPRLVAQLSIGNGNELFFDRSNDGLTWDAPITLPHDGDDTTAFAQTLALGPNGSFAIAARANTGDGVSTCGAPKISRSTDDGTTWTTCGADTTKMLTGVGGKFVSAAFAPSGKLLVAFQVAPNETDPQKSGVAIWREP